MATPAQVLANRENATRSTGPKTEAGKARTAGNALTHGATSRSAVLPHESETEFQAFSDAIIANHAPADEQERRLAAQLAVTAWRVERLYRIETALLQSRLTARLESSKGLDGDTALAEVFADAEEASRLRLILRYTTAAERAHRQILAELTNLQNARRERDAAGTATATVAEAARPQACEAVTQVEQQRASSAASIGSVSQRQENSSPKRTQVAKGVWLISK